MADQKEEEEEEEGDFPVHQIVAVDEDFGIGHSANVDGALPWSLPGEFRRFLGIVTESTV